MNLSGPSLSPYRTTRGEAFMLCGLSGFVWEIAALIAAVAWIAELTGVGR